MCHCFFLNGNWFATFFFNVDCKEAFALFALVLCFIFFNVINFSEFYSSSFAHCRQLLDSSLVNVTLIAD